MTKLTLTKLGIRRIYLDCRYIIIECGTYFLLIRQLSCGSKSNQSSEARNPASNQLI